MPGKKLYLFPVRKMKPNRPDNYWQGEAQGFREKVFTWNPDLIDNKKYFPILASVENAFRS